MAIIRRTPENIATSQDPGLDPVRQSEDRKVLEEINYNNAKPLVLPNNYTVNQVTTIVNNIIQNNPPTGVDGQIQVNENGQLVGDTGLTYVPTTDTLTTGTIVVGNIIVSGVANLGNVNTIVIQGGSPGEVLTSNGTGLVHWATPYPSVANKSGKFLVTDGINVNWSNIAYSSFATTTDVSNAIGNLINSAPTALDTLGELANALGNSGNFTISVVNQLANKVNSNALAVVATSGNFSDLNYKPNLNTYLPSQTSNSGKYLTTNGTSASWGTITIPTDIANLTDNTNILSSYATSSNVSALSNTVANITWANLSGKPTLGNLSSVNKDGNVSNVLYGNGVFAAAPASGASTGNITFSNTTMASTNGNVKIGFSPSASPAVEFTFVTTGNLVLPKGTILSETANSTSITPPNALAGQGLVVRLTGVQGIVSDHPGGFTDGDTITLTVTPDYGSASVTGTVDYTFTGCTSVELGRALTGTLTFTSESFREITWTIPVSSTMTTFTITLSNASGFAITSVDNTLTLTTTGSTEDHHVHLIAGDPSITDIYLGDDDQYVKIEKNGGNVLIGTNTNTKLWKFGTDGNLTLPANTFAVNYANGTQVTLGGSYGNSNVANYLPTYTGNLGNVNNITANTLVVIGNANIQGTLTYNNISSLATSNLVLGLGNNQTGINVTGGGIVVGNTAEASFLYNFSTQTWNSNIGLSAVGNVTGANINTTGKVVASTLTSNVATGTAPFIVTSTTQVANLNVANAGLATYATTANSVAVANVSGIGNIATVNKDGNSSNILYGNGVFASAPVTYGNSNVATFLASYGSNTISTTGNITAGNANLGNAVTANYHIGNLYGTANLATYATTANAVAGANVSGQVANALVAGTVYTNAQPNITSTGTLASLGVTGNVTSGGLTVNGAGVITGNLQVQGTLTYNNISSLTTSNLVLGLGNNQTGISVTGGGIVVGNTAEASFLYNFSTQTWNSNIGLSAVGNITGANINTAGKVVASTLTSNIATGTAPLIVTSTTQVANLNVATAGLATYATTANAVAGANVSGQVSNALVAGTVYTNAQPNITSVGTLTSISVSGNANVGNLGTTGLIVATGNITGGNLVTAGALSVTGNANTGNLGTTTAIITTGNITTINSGLMQNGNSNVTITANANISHFVTGNATSQLTVTATGANIPGYANIVGNANVGNLGAAQGIFTTSANIPIVQNGNSNVTITANANVAVFTAGNATAQFVVTSTGANIPGTANIVGNVNVGNLIGPHANGNSNINMPAANGNINMSVAGNANIFVVTGTGANITGNLNVASGNITGNTNGFAIGYLNIPQIAAANATLALTDAGKHYYSTSSGNFTLTIPTNATVAFATGTAISIVVQSAGNVLVNAASGVTLYMAGNATAGNRVASTYAMATLMKVASDTWMINGTGVS
jgi:hypothetical protein